MPTIDGPKPATACGPNDRTAPPTPVVHRSRAFVRGPADATVAPQANPGRGAGPARDPAYFELHNVEAGTKIQMINISKKPDASFEDAGAIVELTLTGRDINNRQAAFYLTDDQMDAIDLKAGDIYRLRAVDAHGNVSPAVTNELEPDDWANQNIARVTGRDRRGRVATWEGVGRGTIESMLDGEGVRKNIAILGVQDQRPPMLMQEKLALTTLSFNDQERQMSQAVLDAKDAISAKHGGGPWNKDQLLAIAADDNLPAAARKALETMAKEPGFFQKLDDALHADGVIGFSDWEFAAAGKTKVALEADLAIEPHSRVQAFNTRTGEMHEVAVGDDQKLRLALPNVAEGDTLLVQPFDNENHAGQRIELRYSAGCERGFAKPLDVLGARLGGVL